MAPPDATLAAPGASSIRGLLLTTVHQRGFISPEGPPHLWTGRIGTTELRAELPRDVSDLRHTFELKLAAAVTQPQLYAALLGQMALLLGIAYFFVTHLQH